MFRWNLRDEQYKLHKEIPGEEGFIFKVGVLDILILIRQLIIHF